MSFGWSAGDIATAVKLIYNLIQALDTCDGAAGDYREAVGFLQDLKRTLDPLQTLAALNAYPSYARGIEEQVTQIREPIESFLKRVVKFEPALGGKASAGHHRHVFRKLQWHLLSSKEVLALKKKVGSHMRVIDTLLQRLTLDVVTTIKTQLPQDLRTVFDDTLRPDLISLLRENLLPLNEKLLVQNAHQEKLAAGLFEHYNDLSTDIKWMKKQIDKPSLVQIQINSALSGTTRRRSLGPVPDETIVAPVDDDIPEDLESLQEVYYLVFLYLGHFLKNLFLTLSRLVRPSRALVPALLAKYNISFLDALGRPPRVLPYDIFQSLEVLRAFIKQEFRYLPGFSWVARGDYHLMGSKGVTLTASNWNTSIHPGTTVTMSMIVGQAVVSLSRWRKSAFPCTQIKCTGKLEHSMTSLLSTCSICKKEVLLYLVHNQDLTESENTADGTTELESSNRLTNQSQRKQEQRNQMKTIFSQNGNCLGTATPPVEDDVAFFKRITQTLKPEGSLTWQDNSSDGVLASTETGKESSRNQISSNPAAPPVLEAMNSQSGYEMRCEFGYAGCDLSFLNRQAWVAHSVTHFFEGGPPPKTVCIFCDRVFENWEGRMFHIAEHYRLGAKFENSRPDFMVIEYLRKKRLISSEDYECLIGYTERPSVDGLVDFGYTTPEMKSRREKSSEQVLSLSKEDRQRRRNRGSKGKGKGKGK